MHLVLQELLAQFQRAAEAVAEKQMVIEDLIAKYLRRWCDDWERDLEGRPEEVKQSLEGACMEFGDDCGEAQAACSHMLACFWLVLGGRWLPGRQVALVAWWVTEFAVLEAVSAGPEIQHLIRQPAAIVRSFACLRFAVQSAAVLCRAVQASSQRCGS